MTFTRRSKKTLTPRPPAPTVEQRIAALKEAREVLSDAWMASLAIANAVDDAVKQEEQIKALAERLSKLECEKMALEERLRALLAQQFPSDVKRLRQHAETMRRLAAHWKREALKAGVKPAESWTFAGRHDRAVGGA